MLLCLLGIQSPTAPCLGRIHAMENLCKYKTAFHLYQRERFLYFCNKLQSSCTEISSASVLTTIQLVSQVTSICSVYSTIEQMRNESPESCAQYTLTQWTIPTSSTILGLLLTGKLLVLFNIFLMLFFLLYHGESSITVLCT